MNFNVSKNLFDGEDLFDSSSASLINELKLKSFEKYGVDSNCFSKRTEVKVIVLESNSHEVRDKLRRTFPELKFEEMWGLPDKTLLQIFEIGEV